MNDLNSRRRVFSGALREQQVGYCRAVKSGYQIYISGTVPVNKDGSVHAPGDGYQQAKRCFQIVEQALIDLGGSLASVVWTRMYVTDIRRWEEFGRAHQECFGKNPPATSMVEVKSLINPEMLIEIEADAIGD